MCFQKAQQFLDSGKFLTIFQGGFLILAITLIQFENRQSDKPVIPYGGGSTHICKSPDGFFSSIRQM